LAKGALTSACSCWPPAVKDYSSLKKQKERIEVRLSALLFHKGSGRRWFSGSDEFKKSCRAVDLGERAGGLIRPRRSRAISEGLFPISISLGKVWLSGNFGEVIHSSGRSTTGFLTIGKYRYKGRAGAIMRKNGSDYARF